MFKKRQCTCEHVNSVRHPEFESHNTSVAEYFRKYSVGKVDMMPTDPRPEVSDQRTETEMLDDDSKINYLGCDDLDALQEMSDNIENFKKAFAEIELTKAQRERFVEATRILDDPNSSMDKKKEAYEMLEELNDKITRARK